MVHYITKYYVSGHTAEGYVNFLSTNLTGIKRIVVLQHPSNKLKTKIIEKLTAPFEEMEQIEKIESTQSGEYIEGIIMRESSVAVLAEQVVQDEIEGAEYINLEDYLPRKKDKKVMRKFESKINDLYQAAYAHFKKGLSIHDELEKIYIDEMDFAKADQVAEEFILALFKDVEKKEKKAMIYERLFGTNTSDGVVNVVEHLIEPLQNRVFIKGRAGTGKSVFMRKVLDACKQKGLDVELYRCSFDPNSIDMLIIRDLDYCLFDSTDPHEFFPSRKEDKIIDLYEETVTPGTDEKYAIEIKRLTNLYKEEMRAGVKKLKETKTIDLERETNFGKPKDEEIENILQKITM